MASVIMTVISQRLRSATILRPPLGSLSVFRQLLVRRRAGQHAVRGAFEPTALPQYTTFRRSVPPRSLGVGHNIRDLRTQMVQ